MLVELQALVVSTNFGIPRRTAQGVDTNRVSLLVAVMEKRLGLQMLNQDIFVNVAGGLKVDEPGADLGLVAAMASSFRNKLIPADMVVFGEVGLGGEVRGISQAEARIKESAKLGFKRCLLPKQNSGKLKRPEGFELIGVSSVQEAMNALF